MLPLSSERRNIFQFGALRAESYFVPRFPVRSLALLAAVGYRFAATAGSEVGRADAAMGAAG